MEISTTAQAVPEENSPALARAAYGEILERRNAALSPIERHIVERRLLADQPATLEVIGIDRGLTRERVRQIERRAVRRLADARDPRMKAVGRGLPRAAREHRAQENADIARENEIVESALSRLRALPLPVTEDGFLKAGFDPLDSGGTRLLLALASQGVRRDRRLEILELDRRRWLVAGNRTPGKLGPLLTARARQEGVVRDLVEFWTEVEDRLREHVGSDEEAADVAADLIEALGLHEIGGQYAVLAGVDGVVEALTRVLRANGAPMDREELLKYCTHRSTGTVHNALAARPFVKVDRNAYGLEEWGTKPHPQLRDIVYGELDSHGSVAVNYLERLAEDHGYKAASIAFYSALPDVVEEDGVLRRRRPDDPRTMMEPGLDEKCLRVVSGPFRGNWSCILEVSHKRLYHGPQFIRRPLAELLEVEPGTYGATVKVNGISVHDSWGQDPYLFGGDLRPVFDQLGYADGDRVRFIVAGRCELVVEQLPIAEPVGPYETLVFGMALYTAQGRPLPLDAVAASVAYSVGLDARTPLPVVERRLTSRRNRTFSDALCAIFPEELEP